MISTLMGLFSQYLRAPITLTVDGSGNPVATFEPPLSPAELLIYNRIVKLSKSLVVGITPSEWQAIEDDIAGLVTYQGIATPTLVQTVLAVKAQSRILRALLRS